jgi:predicted AlkP superfamily phosphohydrolase/phosphomutase
MEPKRLVVIGIDGFDRVLLDKFLDHMPNLRSLIADGQSLNLVSTFPYDSETAWASIFTGLNPAKTGVLEFKNPFKSTQIKNTEEYVRYQLMGKTVWDKLSQMQKRVCILFPHACYPGWPVNGFLLTRSMKAKEGFPICCIPEVNFKSQDFSNLNTMRNFPTQSNLPQIITDAKDLVSRELQFGLSYLKKEPWDLFFIYSSTIDYIEHFFWHYCDKDDPYYIEDSGFENTIMDFYMLYDDFIGKFQDNLDADQGLMIVSDHGHGKRPVKILNINKLLLEKNYLVVNNSKPKFHAFEEKVKRQLKGMVSDYHLAEYLSPIVRKCPGIKENMTRSSLIDWTKSLCHVSDPSGIKSYSYGGIVINKDLISSEEEYEKIRDDLINSLRDLEDDTTQSIFKWIIKREDLYRGEYIDLFPDVVLALQDEYGVGWETNGPLISNTKTHLMQPGGHKMDSAVLILSNLPRSFRDSVQLMDIAPTIMSIFGDKMSCDGFGIYDSVENKC